MPGGSSSSSGAAAAAAGGGGRASFSSGSSFGGNSSGVSSGSSGGRGSSGGSGSSGSSSGGGRGSSGFVGSPGVVNSAHRSGAVKLVPFAGLFDWNHRSHADPTLGFGRSSHIGVENVMGTLALAAIVGVVLAPAGKRLMNWLTSSFEQPAAGEADAAGDLGKA